MEFPGVGERCNWENCAQLDFLPVQCIYCKKWFCKEHMSALVHKCAHVPDNLKSDEDVANQEKWHFECSLDGCKSKEMVEIKCGKCKLHFCLQHRLPEQHSCPKLGNGYEDDNDKERKIAVENSLDQQRKIKEQIELKLKDAKDKGGTKGAMAKRLALMKLKGRSDGDKAIPQGERIYFTVTVDVHADGPKIFDLYFSKVWTMGKIIDVVARRGRVKNRNNQADAPKLHLFKEDVCLSQPFDKTCTQLLDEGILEDGDAICLKLMP